MRQKEVQEHIQNRFLDIINQNGGQAPGPLSNEEVIIQLEDSLDKLAIAYHDSNIGQEAKESLECSYLEALNSLNELKNHA